MTKLVSPIAFYKLLSVAPLALAAMLAVPTRAEPTNADGGKAGLLKFIEQATHLQHIPTTGEELEAAFGHELVFYAKEPRPEPFVSGFIAKIPRTGFQIFWADGKRPFAIIAIQGLDPAKNPDFPFCITPDEISSTLRPWHLKHQYFIYENLQQVYDSQSGEITSSYYHGTNCLYILNIFFKEE